MTEREKGEMQAVANPALIAYLVKLENRISALETEVANLSSRLTSTGTERIGCNA